MPNVQRIIIVGGGSAGWLSAAYLVRALPDNVSITLIESSDIPAVGVGEATVPSIGREVFGFLGIAEQEWMPACNATYKLGNKFVGWSDPPRPDGSPSGAYFHLFGEVEEIDGLPLTHYWLREPQQSGGLALYQACLPHSTLPERHLSPRTLEGERVCDYAYHFDAGRLAEFLCRWAIERGVTREIADVTAVERDETGAIGSLVLSDGERVRGDLYLDCTGFRGLLLKQGLGEPFVSYNEFLRCDRAVAIHTQQDRADIRCYATGTALSAGWLWEIPLAKRNGNGYVYSSEFLSPAEAEREARAFLGIGPEQGEARHIRMRVGRTRRAWVANCVGIGLSSGFIEPLESTGIYFIYAALYQLVRHFPDSTMQPALRDSFNDRVAFMVDDVTDFVALHYCTTRRQDTPFWQAIQLDTPIPETLRHTLALYHAGVPVRLSYSGSGAPDRYQNFESGFDRFWTNSNYVSVLAGMGVLPRSATPLLCHRSSAIERARARFTEIRAERERIAYGLPSHAAYLRQLYHRAS